MLKLQEEKEACRWREFSTIQHIIDHYNQGPAKSAFEDSSTAMNVSAPHALQIIALQLMRASLVVVPPRRALICCRPRLRSIPLFQQHPVSHNRAGGPPLQQTLQLSYHYFAEPPATHLKREWCARKCSEAQRYRMNTPVLRDHIKTS